MNQQGSYSSEDFPRLSRQERQELMDKAKREALAAFIDNQREVTIWYDLGESLKAITLHIVHAFGQFYQCLLPDGGELFRLVDCGGRVAVLNV